MFPEAGIHPTYPNHLSKLAPLVFNDKSTDDGEMGAPLTHYETENLRISATLRQHHGLAYITD